MLVAPPKKLRFTRIKDIEKRTGRPAREIATAAISARVPLYVDGVDWLVSWGVDPVSAATMPGSPTKWSGRAVAGFGHFAPEFQHGHAAVQTITDDSQDLSTGALMGVIACREPGPDGVLIEVPRTLPQGRLVKAGQFLVRDVDCARLPIAPEPDVLSATKQETALRLLAVVLAMASDPNTGSAIGARIAPAAGGGLELVVSNAKALAERIESFIKAKNVPDMGLGAENIRKYLGESIAAFERSYHTKR